MRFFHQENSKGEDAGAEEKDIISCAEMLRAEKNRHYKLGKYFESINHSISADAKKYAWFNAHIWGL